MCFIWIINLFIISLHHHNKGEQLQYLITNKKFKTMNKFSELEKVFDMHSTYTQKVENYVAGMNGGEPNKVKAPIQMMADFVDRLFDANNTKEQTLEVIENLVRMTKHYAHLESMNIADFEKMVEIEGKIRNEGGSVTNGFYEF